MLQIIIDNNNGITLQNADTACYFSADEVPMALVLFDAECADELSFPDNFEGCSPENIINMYTDEGYLRTDGYRIGYRGDILNIIEQKPI